MAGPRVFVRRSIPAPVAQVFALLTDADGLARWFCDEASSEPRPGGHVRVIWREPDGDALSRSGVWSRFEPPHVATLRWDGPPSWPGEAADVLEFVVAASEDEETLVTVSSGVPGDFERLGTATLADATEASWRQCLGELARVVADDGDAARPSGVGA